MYDELVKCFCDECFTRASLRSALDKNKKTKATKSIMSKHLESVAWPADVKGHSHQPSTVEAKCPGYEIMPKTLTER